MTRSSASAELLVALALGGCVAGASEPSGPRAIAHRGVVQEAPENTWPAIAKAIELGCALAEIDLRYTADGEIVLIHDATVDRTTDGTGRVSDKTLAEIQAIMAEAPGSRVLVDLGDWAQAPGLAEMLRRDIPTAALSGDWALWSKAAVAEAKRRGVLTFVNVLGASDTPENLREAARLGFDYIQTDNPRALIGILREGRAQR